MVDLNDLQGMLRPEAPGGYTRARQRGQKRQLGLAVRLHPPLDGVAARGLEAQGIATASHLHVGVEDGVRQEALCRKPIRHDIGDHRLHRSGQTLGLRPAPTLVGNQG